MLFIPEVVWEWHDMYCYVEKFPHTAPEFHGQRPRYVEFMRYFLGKKREYEVAINRKVPE